MKFLSINLFVMATLIFSTNAFAISNEDLANKCLDAGKVKVAEQAHAWGCNVDLEQVEVLEIDNRWYNPSKYIWYQVTGECNGHDRVVKLVQFTKGKCI